MMERILILDFGSQYTQLIARKVRELNVYCEIHPYNLAPPPDDSFSGLILSGSPASVNDEQAPKVDLSAYWGKCPILGICYGAQYMVHAHGGRVSAAKHREYGRAILVIDDIESPLFEGINKNSQVWMSHGDTMTKLPEGFRVIAHTKDIPVGAYTVDNEAIYGLQFHPEVYHTVEGLALLSNFVVGICACRQSWTADSFVKQTVASLKARIGNDRVVLGLSGGGDSTVAAELLHQAIGNQLVCIFVDNGLLRKNEFETVLESYKDMGLNVLGVDVSARFYEALQGVEAPEEKRKIIGRLFVEVFEEEANKLDGVKWLGQGTIYPDVIESVSVNGPSQTIKSHHNVGGLPERMNLQVIEPLRLLFKDEVRRVGRAMHLPEFFLKRHPFPGPGLAIRILGDITPAKVSLLQEVDAIFIDGLVSHGLYDQVWQAGAILLPVQSVGVMGDERTYENVVALRAVSSTDGMTADWVHLPYDFLALMANQIINKVKGVNRVVYDISSKPPATIEWE